jgi:phage gp36-like protein
MARRYSELEEKYFQGQMDLARVSASLDDANSLNSSLSAQFDSERAANEVSLLDSLCCVFAAYWVLES